MTNEAKARRQVNNALASMSNYHPYIPNGEIDAILMAAGFSGLAEDIYCGRDGRVNEQVGPNTWLAMTWHKMEVSGHYEVVAYVS